MILQNPIKFLLDNYYDLKYKKKSKRLRNKNINFYIAMAYKKTNNNKKFNKVLFIFNPFTTFFLKRNVFYLEKIDIITILDEIDEKGIINNPKYDLMEFYKKEPMTQYEFYSMKNYNFYDSIFFEYTSHGDRNLVFKEIEEYEKSKLVIDFI